MYRLARWICGSLVAVILCLLIVSAIGSYSSAKTIIVDQEGGGDNETITEALDAAMDGDTIRVWDGTYIENVVVDKEVEIIGNGSEVTTIDGGASGTVVTVTVENVSISGLTIRNSGHYPEAGVKVISSFVMIANCSVIHNDGDGLKTENGMNNTVIGCNLSKNENSGLILFNSTNVTIAHCVLQNNIEYGIGLEGSDFNVITACDLKGNGDGFVLETSRYNQILQSSISGSRGIAIWESSSFNTVSWCNISNVGNKGIEVMNSDNNYFNDCMVSDCGLRGMDLTASWTFVTGCIVRDAGQIGIYLNGQEGVIKDCSVSGNEYGIYLYFLSTNNSVYHNELINNTHNGYDGGSNTWDNGYPSGGNHWSDFDEENEGAYDNDTDGIVDDQYQVPGGENIDRYPLGGGMVENQAPIADAGPDQQEVEGVVITFNGSGSSDDSSVVNWTWTFVDNGSRIMYGVAPSYQFNNPGDFLIALTVRDGKGLTNDATMWVNISAVIVGNDTERPIAIAIIPSVVIVGENVTFDGSTSTDNVDIITWKWTFYDPELGTLHGPNPTYVFTRDTISNVHLEVWDAAGNRGSVYTEVIVKFHPCSVSGTVRDSMKRPLEGVAVELQTNHDIYNAITDQNGTFSIVDIRISNTPVNERAIRFSLVNYTTQSIKIIVETGKETNINVTLLIEGERKKKSLLAEICGNTMMICVMVPMAFLHHRRK